MKFLRQDGWFQPVAGADIVTSTATTTGFLTYLTKSTTATIALNNISNFFDGPSVSQGSSGTWFATGTVTLLDTAGADFVAQLWDGTTTIAIAGGFISTNGFVTSVSLSGVMAAPAGNLRISVKDVSTVNGTIASSVVTAAYGSNITAIRIG